MKGFTSDTEIVFSLEDRGCQQKIQSLDAEDLAQTPTTCRLDLTKNQPHLLKTPVRY